MFKFSRGLCFMGVYLIDNGPSKHMPSGLYNPDDLPCSLERTFFFPIPSSHTTFRALSDMAHPLVWPKKIFFYPIGNTPPVCITQELSPEDSGEILLLGCGDPRSIMFTICNDLAPGMLFMSSHVMRPTEFGSRLSQIGHYVL